MSRGKTLKNSKGKIFFGESRRKGGKDRSDVTFNFLGRDPFPIRKRWIPLTKALKS
jgi:hypothetical protein